MNLERNELIAEFEKNKSKLKSFILRMTANADDTEDIVQDTFLKAVENITTFRSESSVKTWLFAIASNITKDRLRAQKRWPINVTDLCKEAALSNQNFFEEAMTIHHTSPQGQFEIKEHIVFCFTCISKTLPLEQQLSILLKEVYEFKISEIATILNTKETNIKYYLSSARQSMIEIFDNRCSIINKDGVCHQCTELNGIFNPLQNQKQELLKINMSKLADKNDKQKLLDLRLEVIRGLDPFESNGATLQLHHLEHNRKVMENYLKENEA